METERKKRSAGKAEIEQRRSRERTEKQEHGRAEKKQKEQRRMGEKVEKEQRSRSSRGARKKRSRAKSLLLVPLCVFQSLWTSCVLCSPFLVLLCVLAFLVLPFM